MVFKKKVGGLFTLLVATTVCASSVSEVPIPKKPQLPREWVEWVETNDPKGVYEQENELVVNTDSKVKKVIYKDEKDAIEDLRKLSHSSDFEDIYVNIPSLDLWVEAGNNEKIKDTGIKNEGGEGNIMRSTVQTDLKYIGKLAKSFKEFTIYHFHPDDDHGLPKGIKNQYFMSALPSENDISNMMYIYFSYEIPNETKITHGVVSQFGTSIFEPNRKCEEDLLRRLRKEGENNVWGGIRWLYGIEMDAWKAEYTLNLSENQDYINKNINDNVNKRFFELGKDPGMVSEEEFYDISAHAIALTVLENFNPLESIFYNVRFKEHGEIK